MDRRFICYVCDFVLGVSEGINELQHYVRPRPIVIKISSQRIVLARSGYQERIAIWQLHHYIV